jgi:hypothetical protein
VGEKKMHCVNKLKGNKLPVRGGGLEERVLCKKTHV